MAGNRDIVLGMRESVAGLLREYGANQQKLQQQRMGRMAALAPAKGTAAVGGDGTTLPASLLPEVLLMYRDGLSDSQFDTALAVEYDAIKQVRAYGTLAPAVRQDVVSTNTIACFPYRFTSKRANPRPGRPAGLRGRWRAVVQAARHVRGGPEEPQHALLPRQRQAQAQVRERPPCGIWMCRTRYFELLHDSAAPCTERTTCCAVFTHSAFVSLVLTNPAVPHAPQPRRTYRVVFCVFLCVAHCAQSATERCPPVPLTPRSVLLSST